LARPLDDAGLKSVEALNMEETLFNELADCACQVSEIARDDRVASPEFFINEAMIKELQKTTVLAQGQV